MLTPNEFHDISKRICQERQVVVLQTEKTCPLYQILEPHEKREKRDLCI